jgi:hypothetical protein
LLKWPQQYYSSLKPKAIDDVLESPVCSIGVFKRTIGEDKATSVLVLILNDVVDFFNVSNSMNAGQILTTAEMILDNYGYLKIDDFKLCFSQAKRNLFGPVYRMDGNVILSWIESYTRDRVNVADEKHYAGHLSIKANERRVPDFQELVNNGIIKGKL